MIDEAVDEAGVMTGPAECANDMWYNTSDYSVK